MTRRPRSTGGVTRTVAPTRLGAVHRHAKSYNGLEAFYAVKQVNQSRGQYVSGDVHTNGIENYWSLTLSASFSFRQSTSAVSSRSSATASIGTTTATPA
jgi:hypothetical protein